MASCFIGWPLGYFWPSAIGLLGFLPAVWLFSIKCHACGYPAFAHFKADEKLNADKRFRARLWGKDHGGIHLPLGSACTRCGASFD